MKLPLQITLRDFGPSDAVESAIREKASKLEQFHPNIMACRVTVTRSAKHKQHGNNYSVAIDVTVPGNEIVINRDHDEDIYVALRDAFDAARRQLDEFSRIQRGEVKQHASV